MQAILGEGVLFIRVDRDERDLFPVIMRGQFRKTRPIHFRQWTFHAKKCHDNEITRLPTRRVVFGSAEILQFKRIDFLTNSVISRPQGRKQVARERLLWRRQPRKSASIDSEWLGCGGNQNERNQKT